MKCMDYQNRPELCKNHGVTYECPYEGCTFKAEMNASQKLLLDLIMEK